MGRVAHDLTNLQSVGKSEIQQSTSMNGSVYILQNHLLFQNVDNFPAKMVITFVQALRGPYRAYSIPQMIHRIRSQSFFVLVRGIIWRK